MNDKTIFETAPVELKNFVDFKAFDYSIACEWVIEKLDWLASEGIIEFKQAELVKYYLPYCDIEDLLIFKLGYKGFITDCIYS